MAGHPSGLTRRLETIGCPLFYHPLPPPPPPPPASQALSVGVAQKASRKILGLDKNGRCSRVTEGQGRLPRESFWILCHQSIWIQIPVQPPISPKTLIKSLPGSSVPLCKRRRKKVRITIGLLRVMNKS